MSDCRLILDPPAAGAWNMAVDEVLWDWSGRTGGCCLRLYRWSEPTLSLGYFQSYDHRRRHEASRSCPVVRRISGGGAILHDAELTYCLVMPFSHPLAASRRRLYEAVHGTIIELLADLGLGASVQSAMSSSKPSTEPFLCFQRRSPGDVLVGPVKIAGSAQRRSRTAVLQHGSLLLARSPAAPELSGLEELAGRRFSLEQLRTQWLKRLSARLEMRWIEAGLSHEEMGMAAQLVVEKHTTESWILYRGRQAG